MAQVIGPPANIIRNRAITAVLKNLLSDAADATGIQKVVVFSGGQTSNHAPHLEDVVGGWTGSRRHDNGRAADIRLIKNGQTLSFTNANGSQVADFVTAAAARGATGIGAGVDYMGPQGIHVGFGKSPNDHQKLTWGKDGASANAPAWLRAAANAGWNQPVGATLAAAFSSEEPLALVSEARATGHSVVAARQGLWLRKGPGLVFDRAKLLEPGTELFVLGLDGDWARVDLRGDGLIDGHVLAAFLDAGDRSAASEGESREEPFNDEAVAALITEAEADADGGTRGAARQPRAAPRRSEK